MISTVFLPHFVPEEMKDNTCREWTITISPNTFTFQRQSFCPEQYFADAKYNCKNSAFCFKMFNDIFNWIFGG